MTSYDKLCPRAKALDVVGERWTLLIVRELLLGNVHFNDLRRGLPRMSSGLLSTRLQMLVRCNIVERVEVEGRTSYSLTASGRELEEVVRALSEWGTAWAGRPTR